MKKLSPVVAVLATCALLFAALLLLSNIRMPSAGIHTWLGALPLALVGIAYALLQIRLKPDRTTLLKRLLLAGTFVLWAIDQFLPAGPLATLVGDIVVSAYVLDLYWIIQEQKNSGS
jgi:phosphatidylserine synthase